MTPSTPPPGRWTSLLRLVPRADRDHLVAELDALYRVRLQRWGKKGADGWYRREVLAIVFAVPLEAGRRSVRRVRQAVSRGLVSGLGRDVARSFRVFRTQPGFAVLAVATLTLGIGAGTVIFSVVDQVVIRSLPFADPDRLVAIWPQQGILRGEVEVLQQEATKLESVAAWLDVDGFNLEHNDGSRRITAMMVSPELLSTLGVETHMGRGFTAEESRPGRDGVALLSWGLWADEYGADAGIIGKSIRLDGTTRNIVGVLPAGFEFPAARDVFVPLLMDAEDAGTFWGWGGHRVIGRLAPGATVATAQEEARRLSLRMRELNVLWTPPEDFRAASTIVPLRDSIVGEVAPTLWMLLGAVALVFLAACANVANLLLVRGLSRGRELAVRAALGAGTARVVGEQLVEALMLSAVGCIAALTAAHWALELLLSYLPPQVPRATEIMLDARVSAWGVAMALLAGGLAGLVPALRVARIDPGRALREGGRGIDGSSPGRRRASAAMVVAQIAVAVVLATGAGLLVRSLGELAAVEPGFRPDGLTTARLTLAGDRYDEGPKMTALFDRVVSRLVEVPTVESVAIASQVPFGPGSGDIATFIEDVTPDPNSLPLLHRAAVSPGFFRTMGIPLRQGRTIRPTDTDDSALVAVVDEVAAQRFWPGESPLGRRIRYPWAGAPWIEVVGVAGGVVDGDLAAPPEPSFYVPLSQAPSGQVSLLVRSRAPEAATAATIREAVGEIDRLVPVSAIAPMERLVWGSMASPRWTASVLSMFALVALGLGCVGVYGVVAYSVRERTREIGVRMALGAAPGRIRRWVLRDSLLLALPGAVLGVLLALPAVRLLSGMLFGISTLDIVTFFGVPVLMVVATTAAAYLPARRATRVDPVDAIRTDG